MQKSQKGLNQQYWMLATHTLLANKHVTTDSFYTNSFQLPFGTHNVWDFWSKLAFE